MPRPVCVKCRVQLKPEENGVDCIERNESGEPYKIWNADLYKCPICGIEVLTGFGRAPIMEHSHPVFDNTVQKLNDRKTVNFV